MKPPVVHDDWEGGMGSRIPGRSNLALARMNLPPCPHCWSRDVTSGITVIGGIGRNRQPIGGTYHSIWCNFCHCTTRNKRTHDEALADWTHIPVDFSADSEHALHFQCVFNPAEDGDAHDEDEKS